MKTLSWFVPAGMAVAVAAGAGCRPEPQPAASPAPQAAATPLPNLPPAEPMTGVPGDQPPQIGDAQVEPPPVETAAPPPPPQRSARKPPAPPRTAPPAEDRDPVMSEQEKRRYEAEAAREQEAREQRERAEAAERARPKVTLPEGSTLRIAMATAVSSKTSRTGDEVEARIEGASSTQDGEISVPRGSVLRGRVEEAVISGRVKGRARVRVVFDEIVVGGVAHKITPIVLVKEAKADTKRDVAVAGGAAAAGAVIGGILDGGDGARKGAVIGGAVGGGTVLATRGSEVEIGPGDRETVQVKEAIRVR